MKFTCQVSISQPLKKTVELFQDPNNLSKWQDGFISSKLISGISNQPGSKTQLLYKQGRGTMELIETLQVYNLPEEMFGEYYHKHMTNTMRVTFTELSPNTTQYTTEIEYTEFRGLFPKLMSFFPSIFKNQTQKWLNNFKTFAESVTP